MAWVADYTSRIAPASLKSAGIVGVCRYVSRSSWKVISGSEYRELLAAGIDVVLNFEDEAEGWMGGGSAGSADATFAANQAQALGYPHGSSIPSSADFNMSSGQWSSAGRAYAQAYRDGLAARGYVAGVYGPYDVLTWCRDLGGYAMFWQSMSTSWSGGRNKNPWPGAHLWQRNQQTVAGQQVDHNDIMQSNWQGGEGDMVNISQDAWDALIWRVEAILNNRAAVAGGPHKDEKNLLHDALKAISEQVAKPPALTGTVDVTMTGTGTLNVTG